MTEKDVIEKLNDFKNAIINLKSDNKELSDKLNNIQNKYDECLNEVSIKNNLLKENSEAIAFLKEELVTTKETLSNKELELSKALENIDELDKQIKVAETESTDDDKDLIKELEEKVQSYRDKYHKEKEHSNNLISVVEKNESKYKKLSEENKSKISDLENKVTEFDNIIKDKDNIIKELEEKLKRYNKINSSDVIVYRFGKTTKEIMFKVVDFVAALYDKIDDSEEIITLNNPNDAKEKLNLSDQEFKIFLDRLMTMSLSGYKLVYTEDNKYKTRIKQEVMESYITEIVN